MEKVGQVAKKHPIITGIAALAGIALAGLAVAGAMKRASQAT